MPKRGDPFPHYLVDIDDVSRRQLPPPAPPGLHQPIFFVFAERGPVNIPVKGSPAYLQRIFGQTTFATKSKYFQHPSVFLRAAMGFQEVWMVRLADEDAAKASLVLIATVTEKALVQYEKAEDGTRLLDEDGEFVPLLDEEDDPIEEDGLEITWSVRAIDYADDETLTNIANETSVVGGNNVTIRPILAVEALDATAAMNFAGFRFFYDEDYSTSVVDNTKAMTYKFAPVMLDETTNIATPIRDIYQAPNIEVTLKRLALDSSVSMYYDIEERIRNQYTSNEGNAPHSLLGLKVHVYDDNVKAIADATLGLSTELTGTEPWAINIISGVDPDGVQYDHLSVTNASAVVHKNRINYLLGGADGDITAESLELLTIAYLGGEVYPAIKDEARYSITHLYDSGYTMAAKLAMIDFMGIRADVAVDLSTQDVTNDPNTASEDQSAGATLRSEALLHPESTFYSTPTIRCSIYQQCGRLQADPTYLKWVPATYNRLVKRCTYDAAQAITGQPTGLPNSAVTVFSEVNWTPVADDQKRLNWSTGLNYMQHYDTKGLHYADYRSVYPYDDSVLSDDINTDYLVYLKHMVRVVWATYAGLRTRPETYADLAALDIDKRAFDAFGGQIVTETTVYQTEEDSALGYRNTAQVRARFPMSARVLNVEIPVDRLV